MDILRFFAFGAPRLSGPEGTITGPAAQRRTIALLAVIAASGPGGVRRDKILELLWPDAEPERARHALTQALYHSRKSAGTNELFIGSGNDIRLNPKVITSDIAEFEAAISAGDFERAAGLYAGPFLDGFSLPTTPEFERWISQQRTRFADRAAQAMDTAAAKAEKAEDWPAAVDWLRRLSVLEPVRGSVAVRLMRAMAASGDRAGALHHARTHAAIVETELETSVDPAVTQLEQQLRAEAVAAASVLVGVPGTPLGTSPAAIFVAKTQDSKQPPGDKQEFEHRQEEQQTSGSRSESSSDPSSEQSTSRLSDAEVIANSRPTPAPAQTASTTIIEESADHPTAALPVLTSVVMSATPPAETVPSYAKRFRARRQLWLSIASACVVFILGIAWFASRDNDDIPQPAGDLLVVTPFRVTGQGTDIAYLSEGLMDLLIATLTNASAINAVDAGVLVRAWKDAGGTSAGGVPFPRALALAKRFGGTQIVGGSALVGPSKLTMTGWLADVSTGQIEAQATVEGSPDSLMTLVDRLSAHLVAVRAGQPARLADRGRGSLAALRTYLSGRAAYRAGQFEVAARRFEAALARDTAFGEAAFWLMLAGQRANQADRRDRGLRLAWAAASTLSDADRAYLTAFAGPRYPLPSSAYEHLQAWESVVSRTDQPEAWQQLGEVLFHYGAVLDIRDARERAERAFRRALALDPNFALPLPYLVQIAALDRDRAKLDSLVPLVASDSSDESDFARWRLALARNDTAMLEAVRARFSRMPLQSLRAIAMAAQYDSAGRDDILPAANMLVRRAIDQESRLDALRGLHSAALQMNRKSLVKQTLDDMNGLRTGARLARRLRVTDALYSRGDSVEAGLSVTRLRGVKITDRQSALDRCVAAQWDIIRGPGVSREQLQSVIVALRDTISPSNNSISTLACGALLETLLDIWQERRSTSPALIMLDSLVSSGAPIGEMQSYLPSSIARITALAGDVSRARELVHMQPYMRGWPGYWAGF